MKEKKKQSYWIWVLVVIALIFVLLVMTNAFQSKKTQKSTNTYEAQQYRSFVTEVSDYTEMFDPSMDYNTAKSELITEIMQKQKTYEDGDGVGYATNMLVNTISSDKSNDTGSLLNSLVSVLGNLLNLDFLGSGSNITTTLTIRSNTVCSQKDIDAKYCVEKLSSKIYVADTNSDKWAVLVHGVNMTGKQMYSAVGDMYTSQGYNVMAVDLRGAGDSDGSVAMGYLESLDVYDWIKDLNDNWQSRYGVKVAPETIVVHGISLGAATTIQLATNPDIAVANGQGGYTKNLTQLNVKGFVDDCGYASMDGIIKGLLSIGDSSQISRLLGSFDIDKIDFMSELQKQAEKLNIGGLKDIDVNSLISGQDTDYLKYFEQFSNQFNNISDELNKYESSGGSYQIPGLDVDSIKDQLSGLSGLWPTSATGRSRIVGVNNSSTFGGSNILDGLIAKVLMSVGNVGLNEDNYEKYSNSFSEGRKFPAGSKVLIIHGTSDSMVPHDNADLIAANVFPATLVHKWDADGQPHAFIVAGFNKNEYSSLIANFTNCVTDSSCTSIAS